MYSVLVTNPAQVQDITRAIASYGFKEEHMFTQDLGPGRGLIVIYTKTDDGR